MYSALKKAFKKTIPKKRWVKKEVKRAEGTTCTYQASDPQDWAAANMSDTSVVVVTGEMAVSVRVAFLACKFKVNGKRAHPSSQFRNEEWQWRRPNFYVFFVSHEWNCVFFEIEQCRVIMLMSQLRMLTPYNGRVNTDTWFSIHLPKLQTNLAEPDNTRTFPPQKTNTETKNNNIDEW